MIATAVVASASAMFAQIETGVPDEWLGIIMLACLFGAIVIGFPIAQTLLVMAFAFGYVGFGSTAFNLFTSKTYETMTNVTLAAVPLFLLMGYVAPGRPPPESDRQAAVP